MEKEKNLFGGDEDLEMLFNDISDSQLFDLSSDLISAANPLFSAMIDQSKKIMGGMVEYKELMMMYTCAMKAVKTKFDILNTEFSIRHQRNPIKFIDTRLKRTSSISEKMERNNIPFSIQNLEDNITDIAGVRVICSYIDDIYVIAKALVQQQDITLVLQKDYIANPKPNGYRSLHLIVSVPVYFADQVKNMKVEVQIRTIAMDFWASLEHQLRYKRDGVDGDKIAAELKDCAEVISDTDFQMLDIRKKLDVTMDNQTEDDILLEKLRKIDMPIE